MADPQAAPKAEASAKTGGPVKNCVGCNKPIKKAKRYYRNGKYYCSKKCFNLTTKSGGKPQEDQTPKEAPKEAAKKE